MGTTRGGRMVGFVVTLAVVALLAAACSSSGTGGDTGEANQAAPQDEGTPTDGGTLRVGLPAEIDGLNPTKNRWSLEGNLIGSSLFDTLMTFDEERNLVPHLATSVTPSADGKVWTIGLRDGVTFHDGTPLDAAAVKLNIDTRRADPLSGGSLAPIEEVVVVDPLTAEVRMNTPWFGYDYTLAAQGGYMVAPTQIQSGDESVKKAIGTGPFRQVGEFTPGQPIVVERNPDYWGQAAHLDGISFKAIVDDTSRKLALDSGDIDLMSTQSPDAISAFRDTSGVIQVEDVAAEESFIMLNQATPPLDNLHARKALAYGIDRQAVVDSIGLGLTTPANGPFTEGERYYNADSGYPDYDPVKAKDELDLYKQDTGQSTLSFTLKASLGEQRVAEAVQAQWSALGIDAAIDPADQSSFLTDMFLGNFQAATFRNFAYVNPDSNYIFWHSSQAKGIGTGSINFGQLKDPALDKALDGARGTNDDAARTEAYIGLTPILNETVPYIWLYHTIWALAGSDKVGGLSNAEKLGFARQDAKPFWNLFWLKQ